MTDTPRPSHFLVLTGAHAGRRVGLSATGAVLGRHPDVDVQLDPAGDLEVSGRHAVVSPTGDAWTINDLSSRNGTFVNGQRIHEATPLAEGDRVRLGANGPLLEFHLGAGDAGGSITRIVRARVASQTVALRRTAVTLAIVLCVVTAAFGAREWHRRDARASEREAMQALVDSVLAAGDVSARRLESRVAALSNALRASREEVRAAQAQLAAAERKGEGDDDVPALRMELQRALADLARQQTAAGLDFESIERHNEPAVALIFVESSSGQISTATAFAVRPDAVLLTNRHAVLGPEGDDQPSRIAIQFAGSRQVWPARIVAVSRESDLAAVKVDNIVGDVPTVGLLNLRPDTLALGAPLALIGYPLGGANGTRGSATPAKPLLSAGVISAVTNDRLEVRGFGAEGGSGSPLFDSNGQVAGILAGGRHDATGRQTLVAVPATAAARLLAAIQ